MGRLLKETEAREFITTYSHYSNSSISATTNKLITTNKVAEMGGHTINSTSSLLVDENNLVGYQVPTQNKLGRYDFYFTSGSGCNLSMIFSRKIFNNTVYTGIRAGLHPSLTFVKNPDNITVCGQLWDQLDVSNKMTLTWVNSNNQNMNRVYLLSMPLTGTTAGMTGENYHIGNVIINCGQIGSKVIRLYFKRVGGSTPNYVYFIVNVTNTNLYSGAYNIHIFYRLTSNNSSFTTVNSSINIPSLGRNGGTASPEVVVRGPVYNYNYTITIYQMDWEINGIRRSSTSNYIKTATYGKTSASGWNINVNVS